MPKRRRKSAEERAAEAQALHDTLTAQVEALIESGEWRRFLEFVRSFHAYSLTNVLLILSQKPEATRVAGFRQWQEKGRQVRKGEKAIRIRGYSTRKVTETDPDTGEEVERHRPTYPILSVFDISQTDPVEGVEQPTEPVQRLEGEDPDGIYAAVVDHLTGRGWTVDRAPIPGETNGYTTTDGTRRVVIETDLSPAQAAKTALHEAAHVVLHTDEDLADYIEHRGVKEAEAEGTAYVLSSMAGLDTSAYSVGYVATWMDGDVEAIKATAANVLTAVHDLADLVTLDKHHEETAAA